MKVLIDSSVWIDYYRPFGTASLRDSVSEALASGRVSTLPLIATEVLRGAPDEGELEALAEDFSALDLLEVDLGVGVGAAGIGMALRHRGVTAPAIDLLIAAAAISGDREVWHQDRHFEAIARVVPLAERRIA